jgi:hypothetical protein
MPQAIRERWICIKRKIIASSISSLSLTVKQLGLYNTLYCILYSVYTVYSTLYTVNTVYSTVYCILYTLYTAYHFLVPTTYYVLRNSKYEVTSVFFEMKADARIGKSLSVCLTHLDHTLLHESPFSL